MRRLLSVIITTQIICTGALAEDGFARANGPMPGDLGQIMKEWECVQGLDTPGYFRSLNGAEVADSTRSQAYSCASFLGDWNGQNDVYAWRGDGVYQGVLFMNNRRPGELYLTGGNNPPAQGVVPPGPWVAKVDATTGKEIWRTVLENGNVSGAWVGAANLNILPDGNIPIAFGNHLVKIDGDTGLLLNHNVLPADAPPEGSNFKHLTISPDGMLIVKNQTRPTPCNIQGTLAAFQCPGGATASPGSTIHVIDPETYEIKASASVPENAVTPHTITTYDGKIAIYVPTIANFYRFIWNPDAQTLTRDNDWVAADYLEPGQTTGDAPGILGDWVIVQVNGLPTKRAASSLVAIHQSDASRITRVYPFGTELPTGISWAPPKAAVDVENSMVFSADLLMKKIGAVELNQETGDMTVAWTRDGATSALQALYGPADKRVLGTAQAEEATTIEALSQTSNPTYKMNAIWLDAMTGELLAESDPLEPMNFNTLLTPGFGGRFYYMDEKGFTVLQPMPNR